MTFKMTLIHVVSSWPIKFAVTINVCFFFSFIRSHQSELWPYWMPYAKSTHKEIQAVFISSLLKKEKAAKWAVPYYLQTAPEDWTQRALTLLNTSSTFVHGSVFNIVHIINLYFIVYSISISITSQCWCIQIVVVMMEFLFQNTIQDCLFGSG